MKCQILFWGENKKNINLLSASLAKSVVKPSVYLLWMKLASDIFSSFFFSLIIHIFKENQENTLKNV